MTVIDTSSSLRLSAGAGRIWDWIWPDPLAQIGTGAAVANIRHRQAGTTAAMTIGTFGTGGSQFNAIYKGSPVVTLVANGSTNGNGYVAYAPSVAPRPILVKGNSIPTSANDHGACSFIANLAFTTNVVSGLIDNGFQILPNLGSGMTVAGGTGGAGFGFNLSAASTIELITRVDAVTPVVRTVLTAAPFDPTQFHSYRFDITSATANTEAQLYVIIDGVLKAQLAWGAGTRLPGYGTTNFGFMPLLFSLSAGQTVNVQLMRVIAAPTLTDCY